VNAKAAEIVSPEFAWPSVEAISVRVRGSIRRGSGGENGSTRMADPELSPLTGIPIVVPKCSAAACPAGAAFWRAVMKTI
jgi:hypothetical protein